MFNSEGTLAGIEVVEIGSAIAGPFASKLLADNGAHVTKIEPIAGSTYRNRPLEYDTHGSDDFVYRFMPYNTSKDSIALDLKSDDGVEILWELLAEADVLLENMRPGAMERLGFGWEAVRDRNPELVYCSVTGYGEEEPYASWPALDTTILAMSGWADQVGDGDRPQRMDVFAIDHATALYATIGILMALVERGVSGEGQRVDVAMFDVAISFLGHHFAEHSGIKADKDIDPAYGGHFAPNGIFESSDGYLALFVPPEAWEAFCEAIDSVEYTDPDHKFATVGDRVRHRSELRTVLEDLFLERTTDEWVSFVEQEAPGAVCSPATRIEDVPTNEIVEARGMAVRDETEELGEYTIPGPAIRFSRSLGGPGSVPAVGEQTEEVLLALGYPEANIEELRNRNVVG